MLPSECPNCGHRHPDANFVMYPGPVQKHLRALAQAALVLVGQYEEDRSDGYSDAVNAAITEAEEDGYLAVNVVIGHAVPKNADSQESPS